MVGEEAPPIEEEERDVFLEIDRRRGLGTFEVVPVFVGESSGLSTDLRRFMNCDRVPIALTVLVELELELERPRDQPQAGCRVRCLSCDICSDCIC